MSPKELLYIEDALGHGVQIKALCDEAEKQLQDAELKGFAKQIAETHTQNFNKLYGLLN